MVQKMRNVTVTDEVRDYPAERGSWAQDGVVRRRRSRTSLANDENHKRPTNCLHKTIGACDDQSRAILPHTSPERPGQPFVEGNPVAKARAAHRRRKLALAATAGFQAVGDVALAPPAHHQRAESTVSLSSFLPSARWARERPRTTPIHEGWILTASICTSSLLLSVFQVSPPCV